MSNSLWHHELQHTSLLCPSLSPRICSNSCPLTRWCQPTISFSVTPFSSCFLSFPASGSFPMSWLSPINSKDEEKKKKNVNSLFYRNKQGHPFFYFYGNKYNWLGRTAVSKSLYYSKSWRIFPCSKILEIYFVEIVNE